VQVQVGVQDVARIPLSGEVAIAADPAGEVLVATGEGFGRAFWNVAEVVEQNLDPEVIQ
jgi:hypothetical protein